MILGSLVVVPVEHLSEEVAFILRLADESRKVAFLAHEGDVGDVVADTLREEVVHALGVLEA